MSTPEPAIATTAVTPPAVTATGKRMGRPKGSTNGSGPTSGRRAAAKREAVASATAKTTAAVVLEGLTGLRSAPESAQALGITVARYYTVEAQAIAGLLAACEPAPPGPSPVLATEREVTRLRQYHRLQEQELARLRAVLRTTQRSLGVQPIAAAPVNAGAKKPGEKGGRTRRSRRPVVRALTVVRRLMANAKTQATAASTTPSSSGTSGIVPGGG